MINDPRATHNFVSTKHIPITPTKAFGVSLGIGETMQGEAECKKLWLHSQGMDVLEDFLPLPLGNSELILGTQWLEKTGTTITD